MPAGEFQRGDKGKFLIGAVEYPTEGWSFRLMGSVAAVHNARDGRKRIAGVEDVEGGTATMPYDAGIRMPRPNDIGVGHFEVSAETGEEYSFNIIITDVGTGYQGFDGVMRHDVSFSLESGTITYPTYA